MNKEEIIGFISGLIIAKFIGVWALAIFLIIYIVSVNSKSS